MLNIDRPLDEIIKESIQAKRANRVARRREQPVNRKQPATKPRSTSTTPSTAQPNDRTVEKDSKPSAIKLRRPIAKKRKNRRKNPASAPIELTTNHKHEKPSVATPSNSAPHFISSAVQRRTNGVKVVVSNLHPGVTQSDIAELFETVGPLKSAILPRYPTGTSTCEAEVTFENMPDALEAIKRYNLVPLDNQPLQITLVTTRTKNTRETQPKKSQVSNEAYREHSRSPADEAFERKESPFADRNRNGQPARRMRRRNRRQYRANPAGAGQDHEDRERRDDRDGYAD